uniref:Uncharacterized protein n=1 Tax=viral metagenome TaxID=1070528 RepID=A0A6M3KJD8_9ZZZZ
MAITALKLFHTIVGDKNFGCYKLTCDNSGSTWSAPIGAIDAAWFENGNNSKAIGTVTWSGVTITFNDISAGVVGSGKYVYAFYIGV